MEELKVRKLVEKILGDNTDLFLVDFKLKGAIGNRKLLIFIDGDEGVTIDRCGQVSRAISTVMEEGDLIEGKYTLEVSSPGLDFPLTHTRQYKKNIGRRLDVKLDGGEKIEGELLQVDDKGLSLSIAGQVKEIGWNKIEETKIKISFK